MIITSEKQLKEGERYYYVNFDNPKLEHQGDGVYIYSALYKNCDKEREEKYGIPSNDGCMLKTDKLEMFAGRNNRSHSTMDTYMEPGWIGHRKFYTKIEETYEECLKIVFEYYRPFGKE